MKVVHGLGSYFPDHGAGSEVYAKELAQGLRGEGIESIIVAALEGYAGYEYEHDGTRVFRYPVHPVRTRRMFRAEVPHSGFTEFRKLLAEQAPDIYHQHSWSLGCNLHHLKAAKEFGIRCLMTIHVPEVICLRGSMMLHGKTPCDGHIEPARCGTCWGMARGLSRPVAAGFAIVPVAVGRIASALLPESRAATALSSAALVKGHGDRILSLAESVDRIVTVCRWAYDALLLNGVPADKLFLCRAGVSGGYPQRPPPQVGQRDRLRIGFLGRWHPLKGVQILVQAIRLMRPEIPIELTLHGLVQGKASGSFRDAMVRLAAGDERIIFREPLSRVDVPAALANFDVIAVPSLTFENAPQVVLEAHAMGTPVAGSNVGGIDELIRDEENGWLLPPSDVNAWARLFTDIAENREIINTIGRGIGRTRTMIEVASDIAALYRTILGRPSKMLSNSYATAVPLPV